jgi:hypothetical protein
MGASWARHLIVWATGLAIAFAPIVFIASRPASASTSFTTIRPPFTGATDYAINFPGAKCGVGPTGMIDDGAHFFVSDLCSKKLYEFPAASGGDAKSTTKFANGLDFGLVVSNGTYFGVGGGHVHTFNPTTGNLTSTVDDGSNRLASCRPVGLVADPLSTDVYVSTFDCGILRVRNPASASPTVISFNGAAYYDGLYFTSDGQQLWAADRNNGGAAQLNRSGGLVTEIHIDAGIDGIAVALDRATGGVANNVFVNGNNGKIYRIDTNNGNAVSVVAKGGTRGDFALVGPDGCLYVTQLDRIEKMAPCFFQAPLPNVSIGSVRVYEGDSAVPASFTVSLDRPSALTVSVNFATADGSAVAPIDYTGALGTVTFAPGVTSRTVTVQVQEDPDDAGTESFSVALSAPTNAALGAHPTGVGTILEDTPHLDVGSAGVFEPVSGTTSATFTVTLSEASPSPVTVQYATAAGTATAPSDYVANRGTLTFAPGTMAQTITVTVNADDDGAATQAFAVNLSVPSGATIANGTGQGTIQDGT